MLRIRIVSAGALTAATLIFLVSGAIAQTTPSGQVGKPMALLAGLNPPHTATSHKAKAHEAKAVSHAKTAHRKTATRMARRPERAPAIAAAPVIDESAPQSVSQDASPQDAGSQNTSQNMPSENALPAQARPTQLNDAAATSTPDATTVADDSSPNSLVMNGQAVEIASPDYLNDIDRSAGDAPPSTSIVAKGEDAGAAPAVQSVFAAPEHREANPISRASWIAQMLAALGGAAAAGTVAWFLIGSGPVRIYG